MAADGVTVNSVQPGLHLTAGCSRSTATRCPTARWVILADFGQVVAFLCSEQARFTTGVQLHVDGGDYSGLQ